MTIIINKPVLPDGATPEQTAEYNTNLAVYEGHLQEIRFNIWDSLDKDDLPDNKIDTVTRLQAAEQAIIAKYGSTVANRAAFEALTPPDQTRLLQGTILQTALYILPTLPQLKRGEFENYQAEYYQITNREKFLTDRLDDLFPEAETSGDLRPTGGCRVTYSVTY